MKKIILSLVIISFLSACSFGNSKPNIEFKEIDAATLRESDKNSRILHNFLVGQIALNNKNYEIAKDSFEEVDHLSHEPVERINEKLALIYLREGDLKNAEIQISKQLLSQNTNSTRLLYAGILVAQDKFDLGFSEYQKLIDEDVANAYLLKSVLLFQNNKKEESLKILKDYLSKTKEAFHLAQYVYAKIIEKDNQTEALSFYKKSYSEKKFKRGKFAFLRLAAELGKFNEISKFCKKNEIAKDSLCSELTRFINNNFSNREKLSAYNAELQKLDNLKFEQKNAHLNLALLLLENQNFFTAQRELEIINANADSKSRVKFYLASLYAGKGNNELALELIQEISSENSIFIKSRIFGSYLAKQSSKIKLSEKLIKEAFKVQPNNQQVFSFLLLILEKQKKYSEMLSILEDKLEKNPENEKLKFSYAFSTFNAGKRSEALKLMEEIIAINPNQSDALNFIAYSLADDNKDLVKANRYIKRALTIKPNDGYYLDTYGWVLFKEKKYEKALEVLSTAIKLTEKDPVIIEHYADVLKAIDNVIEAEKYYKKALEIELNKKNKDTQLIKRINDKLK